MKLVQPGNRPVPSINGKRTMLVDTTNLFWIQRFSDFKKNDDYDPDAWMLFFQNVLNKISILKSKYRIDRVIFCDEGRSIWRKDVYPEYKANRSVELDLYFDDVNYAKSKLKEVIENYSNHFYLSVDKMEADDLIAIYTQEFHLEDNFILIVSTDKDFLQLLNKDNVHQFDPIKFEEKSKNLEEVGFQLFLKCIRGDTGDNITSAYPRVREKKLREAWEEKSGYGMMNIMNTVRKDHLMVKEVFERNKRLIDLTQQPEELREKVKQEFQSLNKSDHQGYSMIKMRQWLKKHDFEKLLEQYGEIENVLT